MVKMLVNIFRPVWWWGGCAIFSGSFCFPVKEDAVMTGKSSCMAYCFPLYLVRCFLPSDQQTRCATSPLFVFPQAGWQRRLGVRSSRPHPGLRRRDRQVQVTTTHSYPVATDYQNLVFGCFRLGAKGTGVGHVAGPHANIYHLP